MGKDTFTATFERNYNIDLLKIFACVAVVGLHTFQKDLSLFNSSLYYLCGFAVPVFFMSSGAILLNRESVEWKYVGRKVADILRIVIIWNVLFIAIRIMADVFLDMDYSFSIYTIPFEILKSLVQKGSLWHFWYFGALLILYAFLPFLRRLNNKQKKKLLIVLLTISIGIYSCSIACAKPVQKNVIQTFRLWTWIFYFVAGGLLYNYGGAKRYRRICVAALFLLSIIIGIYQNIIGRYIIMESTGVLHAEYFYDDPLTMIWIILIFLCVTNIDLSLKMKKIINIVTKLTLGVYILHPIILKVINHVLVIDNIPKSLGSFFVVLSSSFLLSYFCNNVPFIKKMITL